jgi:alpha-glucosidase
METRKFVVAGIWMLAQVGLGADTVVVKSPDGRMAVQVGADGAGRLTYTLSREGEVIVEPSPLGVTADGTPLGRGVSLGQPQRWGEDETYAWRGVHSRARNHFNGIKIPVTHMASRTTYTLEVRVFDDGAGLRYLLPVGGRHRIAGEDTAFQLPANCAIWGQTNTQNYEGFYGRLAIEQVRPDTHFGPPVVVELPGDRGYAAVTEAALFNYSGMTLRAGGGDSRRLAAAFQDDEEWEPDGRVVSPWRVVIVASDLNGLVNSDIIPNLNEPPAAALASADWIRPGRGFWHWWSGTIGNWDSVAFDRQNAWVDQAASFGFEYYLVDAGWEHTWKKPGRDQWALLRELTTYAAGKNVGIFVWKRWKTGKTEGIEMEGLDNPEARRGFFRRCQEAGGAGIKIDFMDSESKEVIDFYTDVLKDAAASRLMIDFHGANKPTGESRPYPNEMTREAVRGLEYNKWSALPPTHYAALPFTRFVAGHADFTPCTFNPAMLKGTTFALQLATAVCFTSPVMFYADKPEVYLQTPAVDVIKAIPSVWDETLVLPGSQIGELAALARRRGTTWFVGIINGGARRSYRLDLVFLSDGPYSCVQLADNPTRSDDLVGGQRNVSHDMSLDVALNAGGGFVAMLKPAR